MFARTAARRIAQVARPALARPASFVGVRGLATGAKQQFSSKSNTALLGATVFGSAILGFYAASQSPVENAAQKLPPAGIKGTATERTFIAVKPE